MDYAVSQGVDGDLILQRICDAPKVDRQTRDNWATRDIQALARTSNISEKEARERYEWTMCDASRVYAKARDDIRKINRGSQQERAPKPATHKKSVDRGKDRDQGIDL